MSYRSAGSCSWINSKLFSTGNKGITCQLWVIRTSLKFKVSRALLRNQWTLPVINIITQGKLCAKPGCYSFSSLRAFLPANIIHNKGSISCPRGCRFRGPFIESCSPGRFYFFWTSAKACCVGCTGLPSTFIYQEMLPNNCAWDNISCLGDQSPQLGICALWGQVLTTTLNTYMMLGVPANFYVPHCWKPDDIAKISKNGFFFWFLSSSSHQTQFRSLFSAQKACTMFSVYFNDSSSHQAVSFRSVFEPETDWLHGVN